MFELHEDLFTVVQWPDIQEYQDLPGFETNSMLINENPLLEEYGNSSYMVRSQWLYQIEEEKNNVCSKK